MKILWFTDTHIYPYHKFSKFTKDSLTTRLNEHIQFYDWLSKRVEEIKPDLVVNTGDTVHIQNLINSQISTTVTKCYKRLISACKNTNSKLIVLIGNHDKESDDAEVIHSLSMLELSDYVTLVDKPKKIENIGFIPHTKLDNKVVNFIQSNQGVIDYLFTHLDFKDAKFSEKVSSDSGLNPNIFKNYKRVFNGHYHLPQILNNIYMVGSPCRTSFFEPSNNLDRGIALIDTSSNTYEVIPNTASPDWVSIPNNKLNIIKEFISKGDFNKYLLINVISENDLNIEGISKDDLDKFKGYEIQNEIELISGISTSRSKEELDSLVEEDLISDFIMNSNSLLDDEKVLTKNYCVETILKLRG